MMRCQFKVESVDSERVIIRDLDLGQVSVTNDAAAVCEHLYALYGERRIFYWDTIGRCDELVHEHGRFTGYKAGPV